MTIPNGFVAPTTVAGFGSQSPMLDSFMVLIWERGYAASAIAARIVAGNMCYSGEKVDLRYLPSKNTMNPTFNASNISRSLEEWQLIVVNRKSLNATEVSTGVETTDANSRILRQGMISCLWNSRLFGSILYCLCGFFM